MASSTENAHLDTLEDALGTEIADRDAFMTAFRGLVSCCSGVEPDADDEDGVESKPSKNASGMPSVMALLGKGKK